MTLNGNGAAARSKRLLLISLLVGAIGAQTTGIASAPACTPGWNVVASYDNSFLWQGLPSHAAQWEGSVEVWKDLAADCTLLRLWIMFTGPDSGGTVTLLGEGIGLTYTVQYPEPFVRYSDKAVNAYGEGASWNPDGYFYSYYAHMHYNINARGAEEYWIGTLHPLQPLGNVWMVRVTGVFAAFSLPLDFVGLTVYAQVHVYPDRCLCSVTAITIP